jgi:hypothetical protein
MIGSNIKKLQKKEEKKLNEIANVDARGRTHIAETVRI